MKVEASPAEPQDASIEARREDERRAPGICRGNHHFIDPDLARTAAEHGRVAAWTEGFRRFGNAVVNRVEGDFAIALDDQDGRQFLAVDRFSIHPLCYAIRDGRLVYAERADALASEGSLIDLQAVVDYLYFHVIPSPRTIYRGVGRLPPGHFALQERGAILIKRWWEPHFIEHAATSFSQLRDEFREALRESVKNQLDGRDVGCFLSGGTDSSTVTGIVGEMTGRPARTYSIGFDAEGYDEMQYARIAARHFGSEHHEYYVTADDIVDAIPRIAAHYDQPFGNSSVVPAFYCAKLAQRTGVELLLAGDGGDELFGGNSRYAKQRVFDAYQHVPGWIRRSIVEPAVSGFPAFKRIAGLRKVASYIEQARVAMPDRMQMGNLATHLGFGAMLTQDVLSSVDIELPARHQRGVYDATASPSLINRMLAYDWRFTLADNDLPKVLGATTLAGVAVRFPFLDDRLVDFSLRLPPSYKVRGLRLRWFFKEALRGFLPAPILRKKKHGFGLPFGVWLTQHPRLRDMAFESVRSLGRRGIVRTTFIDSLLAECVQEHPAYYGELVWILMILEQWLAARPTHRVA